MDRAVTARTLSIFFFNDTATTEIYTLSLHDALPICVVQAASRIGQLDQAFCRSLGILLLPDGCGRTRSEEHTSELQSRPHLVCRLLLEKINITNGRTHSF